MAEHSEPAHMASPAPPVLVVVDADRQDRMATESALVRRFEPDYRVVTAESSTSALAALAIHGYQSIEQVRRHTPHPRQMSSSTFAFFILGWCGSLVETSVMASTGQALTHLPQPLHFAASTT